MGDLQSRTTDESASAGAGETAAPRRIVVGAVIVDDWESPSYVVAARRRRPAHLSGRWEFPGGKVEIGETPEAALRREVAEELGARIVVGPALPGPAEGWVIADDLRLHLFFAVVVDGRLHVGADHDLIRRLRAVDLDTVDWLPADLAAVPAITRLMRR